VSYAAATIATIKLNILPP